MNANRRAALRATLGLAAAPIVLAQGCTSPRARESEPLADSPEERRVLEVLADVDRNQRYLSVPPEGGRLTTHEIDPQRHERARGNFERAGIAKQATIVLGDAHAEVTRIGDPIDFVFLDADRDGYVDYLNKLRPLLRPGGLIAAHNVASASPDSGYLKAVTSDPGLETVFVSTQAAGIDITLKKR